MKKTTKVTISIFAIAVIAVFISQYTSIANGNVEGSIPGVCGDPASSGATCSQGGCHTGAPVISESGWITSNIPNSGYVPGTTYTITATAIGAGHTRFGFEISPQNSIGTILGTLSITDAANTQFSLVNSPTSTPTNSNYITHKTAGTVGSTGSHTWSFNWTAPLGGSSGSVTFYGAFNISNNDANTTGDTIRTSTLTVPQDPTTGIATINGITSDVTVFPNPVNNLLSITNYKDSESMQLTIINTNGQIVKELQQVINNQPINVEDLPNGYYVVKIKTKEGINIQKIIKN